MNMHSISKTPVYIALIIVILFTLPLATFITFQEYRTFKKESDEIGAKLLESRKIEISQRLENVLSNIEYNKSLTETRLKKNISSRVHEAHAIMNRIYKQNKGKMGDAQLRKVVKDALRDIRFNNGRGYYFATDLDGIEQLFADRPELEGTNFLPIKDVQGIFVVREMIRIVKEKQEGFIEYKWTKPNSRGEGFPKIAFVKLFEPFGWLIGTGEYFDDVENDIKQDVLKWIQNTSYGEDGYVFIFDDTGIMLAHGKMQNLVGKNILSMTDANGVNISQVLMSAARQPGGGFVKYMWDKTGNGKLTPKLSHSRHVSQWGWTIGTGIYLDDIDTLLAVKENNIKDAFKGRLAFFFTLLTMMSVVAFFIVRYFSRAVKSGFEAFVTFFEKASLSYEHIDQSRLAFTEFVSLASHANRMVDERVLSEKLLSERTDELRTLSRAMEQSPVSVIVATVNGKIEYVNPRFSLTTGYSFEEVKGTDVRKLLLPDQPPALSQMAWDKIIAGGEWSGEYASRRKDGATCWEMVYAAPVLDDNGVVAHLIVISEDISGRKRLEEELLTVRKLESIGVLAGGIAHDFNNLLQVIMGSISLASLNVKPGDPVSAYLDTAEKATMQANELSFRLLTFAKGGDPIRKCASLVDFLRDSVDAMTSESKITCEYDFQDLLPHIPIDKGQINQVIRNLIINSMEAMNSEGIIKIRAHSTAVSSHENLPLPDGEYVMVAIEDTGNGISQECLPNIFDPYFTSKELGAVKGRGLGLSLCHSIIKKHNGLITVKSIPGVGSTFQIYLPVSA